jgi:hypothetical protein
VRSHDLSQAPAADDPAAMWENGLRLAGAADACPGFPGNRLPFLAQVADQVIQDGNQEAHELISRAAVAARGGEFFNPAKLPLHPPVARR